MPAKLKVYRTAIGFHDAYVAASSQKAALAAWGSDKDLFARGAAELVTDDALAAEALASPGTVIKKLRGTADEQIAALPPDKPKRPAPSKGEPATKPRRQHAPEPKPPPKPRPSRTALAEAERAMADAEAEQAAEMDELRRREQALVAERRALQARHHAATRALAETRQAAEKAYRAALNAWTDQR